MADASKEQSEPAAAEAAKAAAKEPAKEVIPTPAAAALQAPAPVGSPVVGVVASSEKKPVPRGKLRSREPIWSLRKPLPPGVALWVGLALPLLILGLWIGLTAGPHPVVSQSFLPSPKEVLRVLVRDLFTGDRILLAHAGASARRITVAFLLASTLALPLGIFMGAYEAVNRLVDPIMAPLRYLPISAFIPISILWFGIDEKQKIAFLFLGVFVYLLPVVVTAIRAVPEELVQTARTLGASNFQVIRTVLLPAAMPDIWDSFRVMNAISWTYVILAEVINAPNGLGSYIQLAYSHGSKTAPMFAGIGILGIIGVVTDVLLLSMGRLFFPWREGSHG